MLQNIHLKNYKAFQQATIPLKPITILLGANSVGKSSLIQLMLMLQQTGKAGFKSYKSPLKLYGGYVNLGDSINLFRNQNDKEPLQIGFDIKSNRLKNYLKEELIDGYSKNFIQLPLYLPIKGLHELRKKEISEVMDGFQTEKKSTWPRDYWKTTSISCFLQFNKRKFSAEIHKYYFSRDNILKLETI